MSVSRWLAFVCTVVALTFTTGCNAILGDFSSSSSDDGGTAQDVNAPPPNRDASGNVDGPGNPTPDGNVGVDVANDSPVATEAGGDTSVTCAANQKACPDGTCVGNNDVATSCAAPGVCTPCAPPHAVPATSCISGACGFSSCLNGYTDCNGDPSDGCEVHTGNDPLNCGGCGHKCNSTNGAPVCAGGQCTDIICNPGFADCDNNPTNGCETNVVTVTNCGTCGYVCGSANGTPSCTEIGGGDAGAGDAGGDGGANATVCSFTCTAPYAHCPTSADKAGCDIDTNTDNENCGACGKACALGQKCAGGQCACNPTTCPNGCCDSTGACVTSSTAACGAGGNACTVCAAGQECGPANTCICDANSCKNGCCSGNTCITTSADKTCGKAGAACTDCTTNSLACSTDGTQCQCTPTSCASGCCNGNTCVPVGSSQNTNQCGSGGNACGKCASGQACVSGGCSCGGGACAGCCASGSCVTTTGVTQCGANGGVCAACGPNQECNSQGQCVCDANTCPTGCCTATVGGTCITTELTAACGSGGQLCSSCVTGQECAKSAVTQQYSCTCDATSCKNGCCNGNTCVPYAGEGPTECGTAGAQCASCGQGTHCGATTGVCTCDSTSCAGCCVGGPTGACVSSTATSCGIKGATCTTCTVPGQDCNANGQCQCDSTSCGSGCCTAVVGGTCLSGKQNTGCGTGGGLCSTCPNGSGTDCNGVQCVCDSSCGGCCSGNTCEAGNQFGACGSGGNGCSPCVTGQHCGTSGSVNSCVCDNTSCTAGCCTATSNGSCVAYGSEMDNECGKAGAICASCPSGQSCNKTTGVCGCTSSSCPTGCCDGTGACQTSGATTCGTGGNACQDCQSAGVSCVSGQCQQILAVTVGGTGSGTVSSAPAGINNCASSCSSPFNYGQVVVLTATAATGSSFTGWSGGSCSGTGTCSVTMNAAASITANFTINSYALSIKPAGTGSGTVTSLPAGINCGTTCSAPFNYNTSVTLTASPGSESNFTGWTGGGCPAGTGSCTLSVTAATQVTATFTLKQYALNVSATGIGSGAVTTTGNIIDCADSGGTTSGGCTANYDYNTSVTLTAAASTGSSFVGFTGGGCSGASTTCVVQITAVTNVVANFTLQQFTLTVSDTGAGAGVVSSNPAGISCGAACTKAFNYGTVVVLTPTPNSGSAFSSWGGACAGQGATCSVTMNSAQSASASFSLNTYKVTVNNAGPGTITATSGALTCSTPTCSGTFTYGTSLTFVATTPLHTSNFASWTSSQCSGTGNCTFTVVGVSNVTANYNMTVTPVTWDPTWSPSVTYSNGNLSVTSLAGAGSTFNARTTDGLNSGAWYWELTTTGGAAAADSGGIGILSTGFANNSDYLGGVSNSIGFGYGTSNPGWWQNWPGTTTGPAAPPTPINAGIVYMFALNLNAGTLWLGQNGTWTQGNPSTATSPSVTGINFPVYPGATFYSGSPNAFTANFGAQAFDYPVPTGFNPGFYPINVTYGNNNIVCSGSGAWSPNFLFGQAISVPVPTTVVSLGVNTFAAGPSVTLGLYDNTGAGGGPGGLKATTASAASVSGANVLSVTSPVTIPAGTYWIEADFSAIVSICRNSTAATTDYIPLTYGAAFPNPYGSPSTFPDTQIALYLTGY